MACFVCCRPWLHVSCTRVWHMRQPRMTSRLTSQRRSGVTPSECDLALWPCWYFWLRPDLSPVGLFFCKQGVCQPGPGAGRPLLQDWRWPDPAVADLRAAELEWTDMSQPGCVSITPWPDSAHLLPDTTYRNVDGGAENEKVLNLEGWWKFRLMAKGQRAVSDGAVLQGISSVTFCFFVLFCKTLLVVYLGRKVAHKTTCNAK